MATLLSQQSLGVESYEREGFWRPAEKMSAHERGRVNYTLSWIPQDVTTILDVGSGDGKIGYLLRGDYRLTQVDFSFRALTLAKGRRVQARMDQLPFRDRSFDLVVAAEVLEHLDNESLTRSVAEISRVSHRYLMITVPHREHLVEHSIRCPNCGTIFNAWGHVQYFTPERLASLLGGFSPIVLDCFGPPVSDYHPWLLWARQRLGNGWLPWEHSYCPHCRHHVSSPPRRSFVTRACDFVNHHLPSRDTRPTWILGVFSRSDQGSVIGGQQ